MSTIDGPLNVDRFPALASSQAFSIDRLSRSRVAVAPVLEEIADHVCVFAVGSYGRSEAQPATSDFEWLLVYDDERVNRQEVDLLQARITGIFASIFGRDRLSINKTFGETCTLTDLGTNVGGLADTNQMLTYRMLILTEGCPLLPTAAYDQVISLLAKVYAGTSTAGHRLLSLATEIARYWRTLRIDYKFKVDELGKPWGVRSLKLRSARRLSYLASAVHFVAFGPRIHYADAYRFGLLAVADFMKTLGGSPVARLLEATRKLGGGGGELERVLNLYDSIHRELGKPEVRAHLDRLNAEYRFDDDIYELLRRQVRDLHSALADYVVHLPKEPRQQLIEMFLL